MQDLFSSSELIYACRLAVTHSLQVVILPTDDKMHLPLRCEEPVAHAAPIDSLLDSSRSRLRNRDALNRYRLLCGPYLQVLYHEMARWYNARLTRSGASLTQTLNHSDYISLSAHGCCLPACVASSCYPRTEPCGTARSFSSMQTNYSAHNVS